MTQRVIYFTAGPSATVGELADIAKLNAATEQPYSVKVFNSLQSPNYGYGIETADFAAGTIPVAYAAVPVIDPDAIPGTGGVSVGGTVNLTDSYGGTAESVIDTITDGVGAATIADPLKSIFTTGEVSTISNSAGSKTVVATADVATNTFTMAATEAIVSNTNPITMQNSAGAAIAGSHVATVAAGVVANVKLAATIAPIPNAQNIVVQNSAGVVVPGSHPATVAAGALSNVRLAATIAPVANGAALVVPVTGVYATTATVTVANGVVTAIVLS